MKEFTIAVTVVLAVIGGFISMAIYDCKCSARDSYQQGGAAYSAGIPATANPGQRGFAHIWLEGYMDAKRRAENQ